MCACEISKERLNSLFNTVPLNFSWAHTHGHMLRDLVLLFHRSATRQALSFFVLSYPCLSFPRNLIHQMDTILCRIMPSRQRHHDKEADSTSRIQLCQSEPKTHWKISRNQVTASLHKLQVSLKICQMFHKRRTASRPAESWQSTCDRTAS